MTNDEFPMTNEEERTADRYEASQEYRPQLVIGHWDLVIPRDHSRTGS
jgi:hypothetical protein